MVSTESKETVKDTGWKGLGGLDGKIIGTANGKIMMLMK